MKRVVIFLIFVLALVEVFSVLPQRPPTLKLKPENIAQGIIHVHSIFSDGGGSVEEIASAAIDADLDFVILTDHNNSAARQAGKEAHYNGVDVFVETETSTPFGHALAFYSHTPAIQFSDEKIRQRVYEHFLGSQQLDSKAFLAIAHPSNRKRPWDRLDKYSEGIELVNFDSLWRRQLAESPLASTVTLGIYSLNNYLGLLRFSELYRKDFKYWDTMNTVSKGHFGILGHDTHSKIPITKNLALRWPDYQQTFRMASNIVWLENRPEGFKDRKKEIYRSIRSGRVAIVFHMLHPFGGNHWEIRCGKDDFNVGSTVPLRKGCFSKIEIPDTFPYSVRAEIWKDGNLWKDLPNSELKKNIPITEPGTYRVEIWASPRSLFRIALNNDTPYVIYNPIYVQ